MWDHFAADFAETGEAIRDGQEAVLIERGDIAGDIPAIAQDFRCLLGLAEITFHHVRPADQQEAGLADGEWLHRVRVDDAHSDGGQWMTDCAALSAVLTESRWRIAA